jgi:hypothetical protein
MVLAAAVAMFLTLLGFGCTVVPQYEPSSRLRRLSFTFLKTFFGDLTILLSCNDPSDSSEVFSYFLTSSISIYWSAVMILLWFFLAFCCTVPGLLGELEKLVLISCFSVKLVFFLTIALFGFRSAWTVRGDYRSLCLAELNSVSRGFPSSLKTTSPCFIG